MPHWVSLYFEKNFIVDIKDKHSLNGRVMRASYPIMEIQKHTQRTVQSEIMVRNWSIE